MGVQVRPGASIQHTIWRHTHTHVAAGCKSHPRRIPLEAAQWFFFINTCNVSLESGTSEPSRQPLQPGLAPYPAAIAADGPTGGGFYGAEVQQKHNGKTGVEIVGGVPPQPPLCDIPSGCCSFTGPWTVTRSSLRMLRRVAAFCRPLRPVLLLVSFPRSRSLVVGVLGLC